jgi:hypothetical protein
MILNEILEYQNLDKKTDEMVPFDGNYPYTQSILRIPDEEFKKLKRAQFLFNKLYSLAVQDTDFVSEALKPMSNQCGFISYELEVFKSVENQNGKLRASFGNNIFLQQTKNVPDSEYKWIMTAANYLSAEAALQDHYQVNLIKKLNQYVKEDRFKDNLKEQYNILYGSNDINRILPGPMRQNIEHIAQLVQSLNPDSPKIHYLTKTYKGTKAIEIHHFCLNMRLKFGIQVDVIFWDDLEQAFIDYRNKDVYGRGNLFLKNGDRVSLIFTRTELFGHLTGRFIPHDEKMWTDELKYQLKIMDIYKNIQSRSNAVFVPTSGERLVRSRPVEIALKRNLEHFLDKEESKYLAPFFPEHWEIGIEFSSADIGDKSNKKNRLKTYYELILNSEKGSFVAKNALRGYYRPVQSILDARAGQGRNDAMIVKNEKELLDIVSSPDDNHRNLFIMFPQIFPPKHFASIVSLSGDTHNIHSDDSGGAISEIALFGAYIQDSDGKNICNDVTGIGARTRPTDSSHPITNEISYGAMSLLIAD